MIDRLINWLIDWLYSEFLLVFTFDGENNDMGNQTMLFILIFVEISKQQNQYQKNQSV